LLVAIEAALFLLGAMDLEKEGNIGEARKVRD
jgi:hypothetical protein